MARARCFREVSAQAGAEVWRKNAGGEAGQMSALEPVVGCQQVIGAEYEREKPTVGTERCEHPSPAQSSREPRNFRFNHMTVGPTDIY